MLPKTIRIFILFYCVNALCAQDTDLPASSQEAEQIQEVANEADHVLSELKGMHEGSQAVTDSNAPLPLEGPIEAYPAPAAPVVPPGITETEAAPSTFNNQDNEVFERPQVNTTLDEDGDAEATLTLDDKTGDVLVFDVGENNGPDLAADGEESISVDFPDEDVRTIVRNVADLYDLNVVIPQSLVGRASIKLRKVTWRQVLDVVLEPLGFTYIEEGNILKIKSLEELHREPVSTQIFTVNYANALELRDAIGPLVVPAAGGQMQVEISAFKTQTLFNTSNGLCLKMFKSTKNLHKNETNRKLIRDCFATALQLCRGLDGAGVASPAFTGNGGFSRQRVCRGHGNHSG